MTKHVHTMRDGSGSAEYSQFENLSDITANLTESEIVAAVNKAHKVWAEGKASGKKQGAIRKAVNSDPRFKALLAQLKAEQA